MKIHAFQHVPFEGPAMIQNWTQERGYSLNKTHLYESPLTMPELSHYDMLVVMGGPMGVYDEDKHPWLAAEKRHIRAAINAKKPTLGICLGAQLIAASLKARVTPHPHKEIGWFPISISDEAKDHPLLTNIPHTFNVLHWHGDRFDIPKGATHLMRSQACTTQAFLYQQHVLALQFHLEMDEPAVNAIIQACEHELIPKKGIQQQWIQSANVIRNQTRSAQTKHILYTLLDRWASYTNYKSDG